MYRKKLRLYVKRLAPVRTDATSVCIKAATVCTEVASVRTEVAFARTEVNSVHVEVVSCAHRGSFREYRGGLCA